MSRKQRVLTTGSPKRGLGLRALFRRGLSALTVNPHFIVYAPERLVLVVGQHNPGLARLHARFNVSSSANLTACSPFSQEVSAAVNAERTIILEAELRNTG